MTRWCRVVPGLAVLLAMLGLPVASVLCDLACPQAGGAGARASVRVPDRIAAEHRAAPCHESTQASPAMADVTRPASAGIASMATHGCDHPRVVSSRRATEGVRVPAPHAAVAVATTPTWDHRGPHALAAVPTHGRPPTRPPAGAFSPVLRI